MDDFSQRMKWIRFQADRYDNGFHIGFEIGIHRHGWTVAGGIAGKMHYKDDDLPPCPIHFHITLDFAYWYVELTVGKDDPEDDEENDGTETDNTKSIR